MKVLYTNADQFKNKINEMEQRIILENPEIIGINEVKPKTKKVQYNPAEYDVDPNKLYDKWDNNLDNEVGRGQILMVKKSLKSKQVYMNSSFSEGLFAEIKLRNHDRLIVALIYRSESEGNIMADELNKLICELNSKGYTHILIMGDFNYRNIDWFSMSSTVQIENKFIDCISEAYLTQHIDEPTRWRGSDNPSLIDLVITNEEDMVYDIEYQGPLGNSNDVITTN